MNILIKAWSIFCWLKLRLLFYSLLNPVHLSSKLKPTLFLCLRKTSRTFHQADPSKFWWNGATCASVNWSFAWIQVSVRGGILPKCTVFQLSDLLSSIWNAFKTPGCKVFGLHLFMTRCIVWSCAWLLQNSLGLLNRYRGWGFKEKPASKMST